MKILPQMTKSFMDVPPMWAIIGTNLVEMILTVWATGPTKEDAREIAKSRAGEDLLYPIDLRELIFGNTISERDKCVLWLKDVGIPDYIEVAKNLFNSFAVMILGVLGDANESDVCDQLQKIGVDIINPVSSD